MAGAPVGALRVNLSANTAQFEQGMRRAQSVARRTGQDIERSYIRMTQSGVRAFSTLRTHMAAFAGVLAGAALVRQARNAVEWASGLAETARQIGVTVEQLQVLRLAAEQNGASVEGMERAVAILNRTLGQAQAGLPAAVQSFRALGFTPEQIARFRNAGEIFPQVAQAISRFRTESQQAAAAQRVFGRGAADLLPLLAQGAAGYDRATQAAIRNGMVTDEQARKADDAADAIGALAAALRVQLLGAIVDSLPGLLQIVNVLGQIISFAIRAIGLIAQVVGQVASALSHPFARPSRDDLRNNILARQGRLPVAAGQGLLGSTVPGFQPRLGTNLNLAPTRSGGGGHQNNEAARRRHQFETELRRAETEELQARLQNVEDLDERRDINNAIAALERQQWVADQKFAITQGDLTVAQYRQLAAARQNVWTTEGIGRTLEHTRAGQELEAQIAEEQAQAQEETLRSHIELARTADERRRLELELLELTYRRRAQVLQETINQHPGSPAAFQAQSALADLPGRQRAEQRRVMRSTMGPLESFIFDLPQTAEQIRESLQSIAVDGLQSISDGLVDVMTGARKMGDVFRSVITNILSELLRLQIQKAIIGPLANVLGGLFGGGGGGDAGIVGSLMGAGLGLPGRAAGGPVLPGRMYVVGEKGPELLRMGSTGGHVIANDNIGHSGDVHVHQVFKFDGVAVTKDEFMQGLLATRQATLQAVREGRRRSA